MTTNTDRTVTMYNTPTFEIWVEDLLDFLSTHVSESIDDLRSYTASNDFIGIVVTTGPERMIVSAIGLDKPIHTMEFTALMTVWIDEFWESFKNLFSSTNNPKNLSVGWVKGEDRPELWLGFTDDDFYSSHEGAEHLVVKHLREKYGRTIGKRVGNAKLRELAYSDHHAGFGGLSELDIPRNPNEEEKAITIQSDLAVVNTTLAQFAQRHLPEGMSLDEDSHYEVYSDEEGIVFRVTNRHGITVEFTGG